MDHRPFMSPIYLPIEEFDETTEQREQIPESNVESDNDSVQEQNGPHRIRITDCDIRNNQEDDDVVCANERLKQNNEAQDCDNEVGASQNNTPSQLEQNQNGAETDQGETDTEPRDENQQGQPDEENNESRATTETSTENANEMILNSIETALNQIENEARAIVESTERRNENGHRDGDENEVDRSEEALTFDENHFSTPVGGASPARTPRGRRRRTTTSSLEDSEVRTRWGLRGRRGTELNINYSTVLDENVLFPKLPKELSVRHYYVGQLTSVYFHVFCFSILKVLKYL